MLELDADMQVDEGDDDAEMADEFMRDENAQQMEGKLATD